MKKINLINLRLLFLLLLGGALALEAQAQPTTAAAYPFSASSTTYSHISGGTASSITSDDIVQVGIPIGFTFTFCGVGYTTVSASSNGWMSFSNQSGSNLTNSTTYVSTIGPAVMPLWDDVSGVGGSPRYITTGTAPNRVFAFEWRNWRWNYGGANCISFQVKLYEDGRIEFLYQEEGSSGPSSPSATIGIGKTSSDYKTLSSSGSNPTASSTTFTTSINSRPATGQSYMWGQPPCLFVPTDVAATNVRSSQATISWTNGNPPQGYQYVVNQSPGAPNAGAAVPGTSVTVTGLNPGTLYYAHVRAKCSNNSYSAWETISFTTTMCVAPQVSMANITHNSATAVWNSIPIANSYEYSLDVVNVEPTTGTPTQMVTSSSIKFSSLLPATTYYLYARSLCAHSEISEWQLFQFTTMPVCEAPVVNLRNTSTTTMQAEWDEVHSAVGYEYAVRSSEVPPAAGVTIYTNRVDVTIPDDNKAYYLHVRTKCISIFNTSEWATVTLREPPATGVYNINKDESTIFAYPNPVKDVVTIQLNSVEHESKIFVTDIAGKVLESLTPRTTTLELNLSAYAPGVYFIKYVYANNSKTIKISKQ